MLIRTEDEYKREIQDLREALAKVNDEARVLRDNKIDYLLGKQQEDAIRKMRDGGASEKEVDGYIDLQRIIRQSDSANARANHFGERASYLEFALRQALEVPATQSQGQGGGSSGNIWAKVYTEDGYQVSLTLPAASVADALKHVAEIRAAGLLPAPIEPPSTEETETIAVVVRREHIDSTGKVIPIVDLYPDWRGQYGQFRFSTIYLDTPADLAQFEAHAGVKLDSMPIYESQAPIKRNAARPMKHEITCKPFVAVKKYAGDKEVDGKVQRTYKFSHYVSADGMAAATPKLSAPAKPEAPAPATPAANLFERPAVQAAIVAALTKAGLTAGEGLAFLFANIIPGKALTRVSDAHPHITPDEFMKRLPAIGQQYRAQLDAQTQPDPDDDPTPFDDGGSPIEQPGTPRQPVTGKQASSGSGDPFNPPRAAHRIDTPLNGFTGSSTRKIHPLHGERVEIERIEAVRDRRNAGWEHNKWIAHGKTTTSNGIEAAFSLTIWPEDARKLKEAGHAIAWPVTENGYSPFITHPNPLVIAEFRKSSGLCIRSVEPVTTASRKLA